LVDPPRRDRSAHREATRRHGAGLLNQSPPAGWTCPSVLVVEQNVGRLETTVIIANTHCPDAVVSTDQTQLMQAIRDANSRAHEKADPVD
jgi:hypothetical protein